MSDTGTNPAPGNGNPAPAGNFPPIDSPVKGDDADDEPAGLSGGGPSGGPESGE